MIKTDEWTERATSTQRQLLRAQVRRAALEDYYERLVRSRASNGVEAVELIASGEAADEMVALEEELDDARADFEDADARSKLLTEWLSKKPEGSQPADDEENKPKEEDSPRVGL